MLFIWKTLKWMALSCLALTVIMLSSYYYLETQSRALQVDHTDQQAQIATSLNSQPQVMGVGSNLELEDARAQIISNFLQKYNSPLKPHDYFVAMLV